MPESREKLALSSTDTLELLNAREREALADHLALELQRGVREWKWPAVYYEEDTRNGR